MLYTLTFAKLVEGQRTPLIDEQGRQTTLQVEAESRTGAIYHADTAQFCQDNECSVRRVLP